MVQRIKSVLPLENYHLKVVFLSGEEMIYDVNPMIERFDQFKALVSVKGLFEQVRVDVGGYGIIWNDELDLEIEPSM